MGSAATTDGFARLLEVMARLRAADGCPWDRAQSPQSLCAYLLEEAYEAVEAVERLGPAARCVAGELAQAEARAIAAWREELGDVLLQVAFQSHIALENGWFSANDVAHGIADKMTRRHPHVFGDEHAASVEAVRARWDELKRDEGRKGALSGVPVALPALLRAQRVGEKAARVGFDWPDVDGALAKVDEELTELRQAIAAGDSDAAAAELGDALFALVSVGRHAGVDAEAALRETLRRFSRRFDHVEAALSGHDTNASAAQLDTLWQEAKRAERAGDAAETSSAARAADAENIAPAGGR